MNLFTLSFPMSFGMVVLGLIIGCAIAFAFFGVVSGIMIVVLSWVGVIRIIPLIDMVQAICKRVFPETLSGLEDRIRNTFIVNDLRKDGEKEKKGIYMFHPHGVFSLSHVIHTTSGLTDWPTDFNSLKATALKHLFWLPFVSELADRQGVVPCEAGAMKKVLSDGKSISVSPGGMREMLEMKNRQITISLKKRRGIFKIALESGVCLIPVLNYGENELYQIVKGKWIDWIQSWLSVFDICLPIPTIASLKKLINLSIGSDGEKVQTFIGQPILPIAGESVESLKARYIEALQTLYKQTKPGEYENELIII